MRIRLYGYRKCGTSNKAEKLFKDACLDYEFVDITEKAPTAAFLKKVLKQAVNPDGSRSIPLTKLANPSSTTYRELNMKEKLATLKEDELLALLASHSKMIKRPVVTDGERFTVGLNEELFEKIWIKS